MSAPRLLVLDDDVELLSRYESLLDGAGFDVRVMSAASQALACARTFRPHLILVERNLPGLSGAEMVHSFASSAETRTLPVAFLSTDGSWIELLRAVRSGGVDVLPLEPTPEHPERIRRVVIELSGRTPQPNAKEGALRAENLVAIVARNSSTGCIRLNADTAFEGRAVFREGDFVGADFGPMSGLVALEEMLAFSDGVWSFEDITLPRLVYPPPRRAWKPESPTPSTVQPRVLIVDDAPELRRLYEKRLTRASLTVETAEDGEEALEKLAAAEYDVVLADLNMPRLDGWGLLRRMRADHRLREVPVLFLSAHDDYRETLKAAHAGARDYLPKTARGEEIIERVMSAVAPRMSTRAGLAAAGPVTASLNLVGPRWFLTTLADQKVTGRLEASDDWGKATVRLRNGVPVQTLFVTSGRRFTGVHGLARLLASRAPEATFTPEPVDSSLPEEGSMLSALSRAVASLNELEVRVASKKLRHTERFGVDVTLYELYRRIGSGEELAIARAVCEGNVPPSQLVSELGLTEEEIERGLRDLLRRQVISFVDEGSAT